MGDSDEEFEGRGRRGRDKFRRERSDFNERGSRRENWSGRRSGGDGGREGWEERRGRKRDYRERREHFGPGQRGDSPPGKRRMRDWEGGGGGYFGEFMGPYGMPGPWGPPDMPMPMGGDRRGVPPGGMGGPGEPEPTSPSLPVAMLSFKQWLAEQTDDIAEDDAVERYSTYKIEFKRALLSKFFEAHKDEEWFRERYHPRVKDAHEVEVRRQRRERLVAFVDLLQNGHLDSVVLETEKSDLVLRMMDAAMIKMEGGDDNDLRSLDRAPSPTPDRKKKSKGDKASPASKGSVSSKPSVSEETMEPPSPSSVPLPSDPPPSKQGKKEDKKDEGKNGVGDGKGEDGQHHAQQSAVEKQQEFLAQAAKQSAAEKAEKKEKKKHRRRHRDAYSYDTDDDSESDSDSESDAEEPAPPGVDFGPPGVDPAPPGVEAAPGTQDTILNAESITPPGVDSVGEPDTMETNAETDPPAEPISAEADNEKSDSAFDSTTGNAAEAREATTADGAASGDKADVEEGEASGDETTKEAGKDAKSNLPEPRPLHQTKSLYIRNVPPSVTRAELCAVGRKSPGFLRAAMAEPNLERRCLRRAWLTYTKSVNLKDVHWSVNNVKVKDAELNVSINRDAANRVRSISGVALAKQVVWSNIQLAARLVRHLDEQRKVYQADPSESSKGEEDDSSSGKPPLQPLPINKNPILEDLPEREEGEEDEFSESENGGDSDDEAMSRAGSSTISFERDEDQIKLLDRLICYLRLVHSVDFYQGVEYVEEDDMPHRCSIMHVRGVMPHRPTLKDVREHRKHLEQKFSVFLKPKKELSESEVRQLGKRDYDAEIEKFVTENCKEVGKEKYLCPLSGKKFRGPDFVRKHIFNKHSEKIDAVRHDVDFYNAYLRDPQRPQMSSASGSNQGPGAAAGVRGPGGMRVHTPNHPSMMPRPNMGPGGPQGGFDPQGEMFGPPGFMGGWGPRPHMMGYGSPPFMPFPRNFGPPPDMFGRGPPFPPHRGRGGRHDRKMISYHDLDQPEEVDF